MKTYIGIDYHKRYSYGVIMTERRQIIKQGRFDNHPQALREFIGNNGGPGCKAVLEATRNWTVMHDWLEEHADEVVLAHPLKLKAIAEARIKTDKIDATTLAELLRCELIPCAHVSSPQARVIKRLLRHRIFLVRLRTMAKNRIHDLLDRHPLLRAQRQAEYLFSGVGIAWMRQLELPEAERDVLDSELTLLEHLNGQVKDADGLLKRVGRNDARVRRLKTIPGIGPFIAMVLISEIDTVDRFRSAAKLHAYAGVIPSTRASGGKTYHGGIIKASNKYLRWAMIEAVWPAIRKDWALRQMYDRLAKRKGTNTARVAVARRLLSIVYRVLKDNRDYQPNVTIQRTSAGLGTA
ncbi:MAG: IS110 family RNA-guided transposase [Planctomycetota bacterium]|jgi:transposase